jgi:putative nucleotidyltransferase with HDIG domain
MVVMMGSTAGALAGLAGAPDGRAATIASRAMLAALGAFLVNVLATAVIATARQVRPLRACLAATGVTCGMAFALGAPLAFVLAAAENRVGAALLLVLVLPLVAGTSLVRLYREKVALAMRLSEGNMTFALSLVRALDARDHGTAGHSAAVAAYCRDIARKMGLAEAEVAKIQLAGLLHDIGKIGLPNEVLHKQGRLDENEWKMIKAHPGTGADIAAESPAFREIAAFIRSHHERPDGRGYPDALVGDEIPLASSIIGAADAYNAMTSHRAYRQAMAPEEAMEQLQEGAGTQFDQLVVHFFLAVLHEHGPLYQIGEGDLFSLEGQRSSILRQLGDRSTAPPMLAGAAA